MWGTAQQQGVLSPSAQQGMPCSSSIFRWKWQQKAAQVCCSSSNPWWNGSSFASIRGAGHHPQDDQPWASLETSIQGRCFFLWPRDSSFCRELLRGAGRLGRGIELWQAACSGQTLCLPGRLFFPTQRLRTTRSHWYGDPTTVFSHWETPVGFLKNLTQFPQVAPAGTSGSPRGTR